MRFNNYIWPCNHHIPSHSKSRTFFYFESLSGHFFLLPFRCRSGNPCSWGRASRLCLLWLEVARGTGTLALDWWLSCSCKVQSLVLVQLLPQLPLARKCVCHSFPFLSSRCWAFYTPKDQQKDPVETEPSRVTDGFPFTPSLGPGCRDLGRVRQWTTLAVWRAALYSGPKQTPSSSALFGV